MAETTQLAFCKPWKSSNLVLFVENTKLHVHRDILIVCSPVFEGMLTSGFKEKNASEIPLPNKKVGEIEEMLRAIYPNREHYVTSDNCFFLLKLSVEYQIGFLKGRCEKYIKAWSKKNMTKDEAIESILLGQKYMLNDQVVQSCMARFVSQEISWESLKKHHLYAQLEPAYAERLVEERVKYLETSREVERKKYKRDIEAAQRPWEEDFDDWQ